MNSKRLMIAALAILLVGGIIATRPRPGEQQSEPAAAAASDTSRLPHAAVTKAVISSESPPGIDRWRESVTDARLFTRYEGRSLTSLEQASYEVLKQDRELATFSYFHRKGLLSTEERASYRALLADPTVLAAAKSELLSADDQSDKNFDKVRRLIHVDLLREATLWLENPIREDALQTTEEIIEYNNLLSHLDRDILASLAANKLELLELLYDAAPLRATQLVARNQETEMGALLRHLMADIQKKKEFEVANAPSSARSEKVTP